MGLEDEVDFEHALLAAARTAIVVCDAAGRIGYASQDAVRLLGPGIVGHPLTALLAPDARDAAEAYLQRLVASGPGDVAFLDVRTASAGRERALELLGVNRLADPQLRGIVVSVHDVTERARREQELTRAATTDALTGLANRVVLRDRLDELARAGSAGAVVLIDLDQFKSVNDGIGHRVGDAVLQEIARRLAAGVAGQRSSTVARVGGDEFAVLLPGAAIAQAEAVAEQLRDAVAAPIALDDRFAAVTACFGVAAVDGASPDVALQAADRAAYAAKRTGRNRVVVHTAELDRPRHTTHQELEALRVRAAQLEVEARIDELTSLPNRRRFNEDLARLDADARRQRRPYCVVFLDLDHFGALNKHATTQAGDVALQAAAHAFRSALRTDDVVYRHGGEEFAALLPDTRLGTALAVAERMREALAALEHPHGGHPACTVVTASVGVSELDEDAHGDAAAVVAAADRAMLQAKAAGRDCVVAAGLPAMPGGPR